jgi:succinate dehydrogenase / fumarate reductase cytochrome b subunit
MVRFRARVCMRSASRLRRRLLIHEEGKGSMLRLFSDSIGRKAVMAVTGLLMVLFVVGHLLGNLTIFAGQNGLNAYAAKLHEVAPLVWGTRIVMGVALVLHVVLAIQITMENSAAKPQNYARPNYLRATFSSKTMIWTGVIIAVFVGYHLLQFTIRKTPGLVLGTDALNRFDVYTMVVAAFQRTLTALLYVVAMVALFLHLGHGIQSAFQTLGLSNGMLLPRFELAGKVVSGIFLVGFASIPVFILIGFLPR